MVTGLFEKERVKVSVKVTFKDLVRLRVESEV